MSKSLYIAEKPSVAREFARALKINAAQKDGCLESEEAIITWCVGHLVTMSYPDKYDQKYKRWSLDTLPFLPKEFKYELIPSVAKQFKIVSGLLNRSDVSVIYVCTDSGREGEYIYRLVEMMAKTKGKERRRVWIDSQTEEEILRGIREAKPLEEYDNLASSAYLRAKEDYLMGINFSRLLSVKYGNTVSNYLNTKYTAISVGRVMTCVLGMVVRREREIREFVKTPFYRVLGAFEIDGNSFDGEWRGVEGSRYFQSPLLYKENGFKKRETAEELIGILTAKPPVQAVIESIERKKENKNPPLLFNLAELQNQCARLLKMSPDETLKITQELYEKKLVTYPRTDARVLSVAISKEIHKNISGLKNYVHGAGYAKEILDQGTYKNIGKSRYVNDKKITDHYAIIPTGQGLHTLQSLTKTAQMVYEMIVQRFLSIFYPPAVYQKVSLITVVEKERLFSSFKVLLSEGYLKIAQNSFAQKKEDSDEKTGDVTYDVSFLEKLKALKKNGILPVDGFTVKEGETSPPKRYTSGSMILAMENAGQLIEDEELRAQIKSSGIGTSATRAEILKKLVTIKYLSLNKKTQVVTPALLGEMIFDVVNASIRSLLNPELTASWEKGLMYVADGDITSEEYMAKLENFITSRTQAVLQLNNQWALQQCFENVKQYYKKGKSK